MVFNQYYIISLPPSYLENLKKSSKPYNYQKVIFKGETIYFFEYNKFYKVFIL